jgi:hypothetical protein
MCNIEHKELWGSGRRAPNFNLGVICCQQPWMPASNSGLSVPSSARVRVCSGRCAPRGVHCICWRLVKRLLITVFTVDSAKHEEIG